ncbi:MAG: amidohydrolase family protein [Pseudomonadota bacterium]
MTYRVLLAAALLFAGCADDQAGRSANASAETAEPVSIPSDPYPSTYAPFPSGATVIRGGVILTGDGERLDDGAILIEDGVIAAIGDAVDAPEGAREIDATGRWITPGVIDIHSHLGVYPSPSVPSTEDGNEDTNPVTGQVWAEHSIWAQDPGFGKALAGGVTTLHVMPGSANLFGGRTVTLKNVMSRTVQEMKFPGAPYGLKMACGENPKRVYGEYKGRAPATRMASFAGYRQAWIDAGEYAQKWIEYRKKAESGDARAKPPARNLNKETLAAALEGDILVHMHCYRADEMAFILDMAKEFDYQVTAFHHAVEAYKIADLLAESGACSAVWADWWGFKLEAYDAIAENAALLEKAGACAVIHSDSPVGIQRLNQEAAKAMAAAQEMGLDIDRADAIRWITLNPAEALGIDEAVGSLEAQKAADIVIWSGDPFSVYSKADQVFIDGALLYDRADHSLTPRSDFEIGQRALDALSEGDAR